MAGMTTKSFLWKLCNRLRRLRASERGNIAVIGNLSVSGTGDLTGSAPATDVVIVIENGSLIVDDKATINTARTAIVFTGDNNWPAKIEFPYGAG